MIQCKRRSALVTPSSTDALVAVLLSVQSRGSNLTEQGQWDNSTHNSKGRVREGSI